MSNELRILSLFSVILVFLLPVNIFGQTDDGWDDVTLIDVSVVGEPVINLDSSNTLLRVYVDITNFDPADGYYYLRVTQSSTGTIISEEEIVIREKSNGEAGADVGHLITEDELSHTGVVQGDYEVSVFTEAGTASGKTTFSIIKPSEFPPPSTEVESDETSTEVESDETSSDTDESIQPVSDENNSELINDKKIPDWVKNIFVLYSYDEITENELINALKFLIEQGIIKINQ